MNYINPELLRSLVKKKSTAPPINNRVFYSLSLFLYPFFVYHDSFVFRTSFSRFSDSFPLFSSVKGNLWIRYTLFLTRFASSPLSRVRWPEEEEREEEEEEERMEGEEDGENVEEDGRKI